MTRLIISIQNSEFEMSLLTSAPTRVAKRNVSGILNSVDTLNHSFLFDQNFLWASCIWGAVASGFCIYGMKQRSLIPFLGGFAMTVMSFIGPNALVMSLVCIVAIVAVWWLIKQGY